MKKMDKKLNMYLDRELHEAAKEKARKMGVSLSTLIRMFLYQIVHSENDEAVIRIFLK